MNVLSEAGLRLEGRGYVLVRKEAGHSASAIDTALGPLAIESAFSLADFTLPP